MDHSLKIHQMGEIEREIQRTLFNEYNLPFSVVAPFDSSCPDLVGVDPYVVSTSSKSGTLDMLLNAGLFHNTFSQLCFDRGKPAFGSSANISLTGSKFRIADIEPELIDVANRLGCTPAQVAIKFCHDLGCITIPKSSRADRIAENLASLEVDLSAEQESLAAMECGYISGWDPTSEP